MRVTRTLPTAGRRMVGAWCFADAYGPEPAAMTRAAPPAHGSADGELARRGRGAPPRHPRQRAGDQARAAQPDDRRTRDRPPEQSDYGRLHGAQLWVALPEDARRSAPPSSTIPICRSSPRPGCSVTVLLGELGGDDLARHRPHAHRGGGDRGHRAVAAAAAARLGVRGARAVRDRRGRRSAALAGAAALPGRGPDRRSTLSGDARLLLLGGEPFEERIVMWWNFVGRSHEEIVEFRRDLGRGRLRAGARLRRRPSRAPELPSLPLKPRGRVR